MASCLQYPKLEGHAKPIRLLTLQPGNEYDAIQCGLDVLCLSESPTYEALSYVWGTCDNKSFIFVNDFAFSVTQNLGCALRHLRLTDEPRKLWVDAICINQEDLMERSDQVAIMRHIYKAAKRVLVWLGNDNEPEDQDLAGKFMLKGVDLISTGDRISTAKALLLAAEIEWLEKDGDYSPLELKIDDNRLINWANLARLFNRAWFKRLWIIQEVAMASDVVGVVGWETFPWTVMILSARCISIVTHLKFDSNSRLLHSLPASSVFGANICCGYYNRPGPLHSTATLLNLVFFLETQAVSDPRDRIYALMGLASDTDQVTALKADYTKSVDAVYLQFARFSISNSAALDILCACTTSIRDVAWPSWCPNWESRHNSDRRLTNDQKLTIGCLGQQNCDYFGARFENTLGNGEPGILRWNAARDSRAEFTFLENLNILQVKGVLLDTVQLIGPANHAIEKEDAWGQWKDINILLICWYLEVCRHEEVLKRYGSSIEVFNAFRRTVLRNRDSNGHQLPSADYLYKFDVLVLGLDLPENFQPTTSNPRFEFLRLLHKDILFSVGLQIFVTEGGYLGMVHESVELKTGDKACVLFGGPAPFLLRAQQERFCLLGACYVDGLMEGEAIKMVQDGIIDVRQFDIE